MSSHKNASADREHTPSTQPLPRRGRSQPTAASESDEHAHFPTIPTIFPVPTVTLPGHTPTETGHPDQPPSSNVASDLAPTFEPLSATTSTSKKRPSEPNEPPAKRSKKPTKKTTAKSVQESLQGIAPPQLFVPTNEPEDLEMDNQHTQPRNSTSFYWRFVYSLMSKQQPESYSETTMTPLQGKPTKTKIVGCIACNWPSDDGHKSRAWKTFGINGGELSNIKRHLERYHPEILPSTSKNSGEGGPPLSNNTTLAPFDNENFVDKLVTWIIADDQALRVVDSPHFRSMILTVNPATSEKDIPHRTTISTHVFMRYKQDRSQLREVLKKSMGRISLTSDLWSDSNRTSFMAITLHWIAASNDGQGLELKTALGGFRWIKDKHSGENIAARFIDILTELDILDNIGGITMDNATNNDTAMDSFMRCLEERNIKFNAQQQRIRCFAHVLNLAVQDALAELPKPQDFDLRHIRDDTLKAEWRNGQIDVGYRSSLQSDLVDRVQTIIRTVRALGQRREALDNTLNRGNQAGFFQPRLRPLQLLRHVPTRWSSTYYMLQRFQYLSPAISLLIQQDSNVTSLTREDMLGVTDSIVLADIITVLSFFSTVQETLACEKTPTLPFVLPLYEHLLSLLEILRHEFPKLMHAVHASLKKLEKYHQDCKGSNLYTLATILNPVVKMEWMNARWNPEDIEAAKVAARTAMAMYTPPVRRPLPPPPNPTRLTGSGLSERNLNRNINTLSALAAKLKHRAATPPQEIQPESDEDKQHRLEAVMRLEIEEEFNAYIAEGPLDPGTDHSFHTILSYWKESSIKFPRLFQIAMTILAVPATSVPSERVFSSSSRTDTAARNRLSPRLMEALQVLKFNGRNHALDFSIALKENCDDLEAIIAGEETEWELTEAVERVLVGEQ